MSEHLLCIDDLGLVGIQQVLELTEACEEISNRTIPKVPTLRGKTVATLFFENSTRTRLSFETAAKRLSADTMTFTAATSSIAKGESLRDTVETIDAMGVDAMVIRHPSSGAPAHIAKWVKASVINAGDGQHEHPTQALLDCYTIRRSLGLAAGTDFSGLRVSIVGDVRHSRVARSNVAALAALGASVTLVAPRTLLPPSLEGWPVNVTSDLDAVLESTDVCYLLRLQAERMVGPLIPNLDEYSRRFGLSKPRANRLPEQALILHPGPMNRGLEIDDEVADRANSRIVDQVRSGVAVRMAVLYLLLGTPGALAGDRVLDEFSTTIGATSAAV